jgi:hypothetical protein
VTVVEYSSGISSQETWSTFYKVTNMLSTVYNLTPSIQVHKHECTRERDYFQCCLYIVLASSGIDHDVKVWSPLLPEPRNLGDVTKV